MDNTTAVATIIFIVNNETNTTSRSTLHNRVIDTTALNEAGTHLASLTRVEGSSTVTHIV